MDPGYFCETSLQILSHCLTAPVGSTHCMYGFLQFGLHNPPLDWLWANLGALLAQPQKKHGCPVSTLAYFRGKVFLGKPWVALGMLTHFALTMLWRLAKAGFRPRLRVHSLKANGGHIASIRS